MDPPLLTQPHKPFPYPMRIDIYPILKKPWGIWKIVQLEKTTTYVIEYLSNNRLWGGEKLMEETKHLINELSYPKSSWPAVPFEDWI